MLERISYPLPRRATRPSGERFVSVPYEEGDVLSSLLSGGWFAQTTPYDFADDKAASFARGSMGVLKDLSL